MPEQSLLDKALEEIGGKADKAGKTCEKLMILIEDTGWEDQDTGRVAKMPSKHIMWETLKEQWWIFSR